MKIAYVSDLHTEFPASRCPEFEECDVAVLAGDISLAYCWSNVTSKKLN